ncbi:MAG TPA: metal-dependent hydrolase [Burkholderiaceae bacterium]|nr:metal-dependent hydrolase [Burkholderiaceae bacterium]
MPTILTHTAVPLALGIGLGRSVVSRRLFATGIAASMLPDLDVVAFRFHIPYADSFGHRGISHSLVFALCAALVALIFAPQLKSKSKPVTAFLFVGIAMASHGLLDMFTNGGLGVALWWPISAERVFAPWRVIEVSPIGLRGIFSERGLMVLKSEMLWVWLPAIVICGVLMFLRRNIVYATKIHSSGSGAPFSKFRSGK